MDINSNSLIQLIDLTLLNPTATEEEHRVLCQKAVMPEVSVAAVCVFPAWITFCKKQLPNTVSVATVVNFPGGDLSVMQVTQEIKAALAAGADEIDVVFPYQKFLQGEFKFCEDLLRQVKVEVGHQPWKVILETGAFPDMLALEKACDLVLNFSPTFLKTSTGKIAVGATLSAAEVFMKAIQKKGVTCGIKISGGIRTPEDIVPYLELAKEYFGEVYWQPKFFRIGASQLLDALCSKKPMSCERGDY